MRIERNHVYTGDIKSLKGPKESKINKIFKSNAPIAASSSSLAGRVTVPKGVTKRGHELSKEVGGIVKKIPTPFSNRS